MMRWPAAASRPVVSTSRTIWRMARESREDACGLRPEQRVDGAIRKRVDTLVARVAGVALDPVPLELVGRAQPVERLPQILVLHGLLVCGFPAARLPVGHPFQHALPNVLRIRVDAPTHRALERFQRAD